MRQAIFFLLAFLFMTASARAEDIAVIFTGNTYSSLYDCGHCPSGTGGAVTRRATALDELRKKYPLCAVVDAGNFTAGGTLDEFHSTQDLDKTRTEVYLEALSAMGYDALCLGDEDFNFGTSFISKRKVRSSFDFISVNAGVKSVKPFVIRRLGQIRAAFIGLTSPVVAQRLGKAAPDWRDALSRTLRSLKGKADLYILLSNLGDNLNKEIAAEFPQIKVIITSGNMLAMAPYEKIGDTVLCRPAYQGKELRALLLSMQEGEITGSRLEQVMLGDDVAEDESLKAKIPACFCDADCTLPSSGSKICKDPGTDRAECGLSEGGAFKAVVVTDTACPSCSTEFTKGFLNSRVPGVKIETIDFRDPRAEEYVSEYKLTKIPSFLLFSVESDSPGFGQFADFLEIKGSAGVIKPEYSGVCMFLNRQVMPGRVEVFADVFDPALKDVVAALDQVRAEKTAEVVLHFYSGSGPDRQMPFAAVNTRDEADRFRAVQLRYPDLFWQYSVRRSAALADTWWISLFEELGIDYRDIRGTMASPEYEAFSRQEDSSREELSINEGIALLVGNKYLFRIMRLDKEELGRLLDYVASSR